MSCRLVQVVAAELYRKGWQGSIVDTAGQRRDRQVVVVRSIAVDMHNNFAKLAAVAVVLGGDYPPS